MQVISLLAWLTRLTSIQHIDCILSQLFCTKLLSLLIIMSGPIADISVMRLSASWCHFRQWPGT